MDRAFNRTFDGRNSSVRGRGRGGSQRGRGARQAFVGGRMMSSGSRRFPQGSLRVNSGPSASMISKSFRGAKNFPWKQELFEDSLAAAGLPPMESETKLHVSNLDIGVNSDDIRDIFSVAGELNRYALHYNKDGLPTGSAEVVYVKRSDAFAAMKRYNNVKLDGRPLKIEVISPTPAVPVSARVNVTGRLNGAAVRRVVITPGGDRVKPMARGNQGAFQQRARGGMRNNMRGRGGGRGYGRSQPQAQSNSRGGGRRSRKKQQPKEKSVQELDMELDKYHAEAMETS